MLTQKFLQKISDSNYSVKEVMKNHNGFGPRNIFLHYVFSVLKSPVKPLPNSGISLNESFLKSRAENINL